ncbi:MAG: lysoplasmalogenase family protein, partial [Chloroflexota bacterium]
MLTLLFSIAIFISATLHIWAEYYGSRTQIYICKPLTTTLILILAWLAPNAITPFYQYAIVLGLLFSLGGDIFLMLPS